MKRAYVWNNTDKNSPTQEYIILAKTHSFDSELYTKKGELLKPQPYFFLFYASTSIQKVLF